MVVHGPFTMTTQQTNIAPKRGIVKQVLSGDSVIIRASVGAPPPEKQINFSSIVAPKLARRPTDAKFLKNQFGHNFDHPISDSPTKGTEILEEEYSLDNTDSDFLLVTAKKSRSQEEAKDEPWAWDAREFLRKKLVGEEVWFTFEKPPNAVREYGCVYLGKDFNTAENITETLVSEGLVSVRREGVRNSPEIARLIELEEAAKAAGKGKWGSNNQDHVRDIKWSVENMKAFVDKQQGKPIKAIIEHVRDGSTVRAFLIPDFYHITLMISGIRCPGFKLNEQGKPDPNTKVPYAEEARYFVEIRLLQQEIEIVLESVNNNNFVGTILHPKGNIAEALLKEGFARCVDWSIAVMHSGAAGADRLRSAERKAKEARMRLWKDWQSSAPQITGKERDFQGTVVEIINGDAMMVKLGNGQVKKIFLSSIRPPKEAGRGTDDDGKPTARPKGFRPLYDIPWMFEAREFLRKKLIGKKVHVVIDYIQEARDNFPEKVCATITIGGVNVAEALVSKGYATVVRYRQDDDQRSSRYDDLLTAENKAIKSQKGVHAKKDIPVHRVMEIDAAKAKQFLPSFTRAQRIEAIVEFVASGSRLRLFIPKEHCLCTFLLGGISCPRGARPAMGNIPPSEAEPYGEEALVFTKERCLQREVTIQVESADKAGSFIGYLWVDNVNLSIALVEDGFAAVHPTADKSEYGRHLKAAEDKAKQMKLRRWKEYVEAQEEEQRIEEDRANPERKVNYEEVVVTEITPEGTFYAQNFALGPKAEALQAKLKQEFSANPPIGAYNPKRNDICAAKYSADNEWYRAKIEKVQGNTVNVLYIDYGNREVLNSSRLASLPAAFTSEKPFATEYSLACVTLPKDPDYAQSAIKYLREDTAAGKLLLNVEYKVPGQPPAATLVTEGQEDDIIKNLILDGLLLVENRREKRLSKLINDYKAAQETAKKNHTNIWEYGDITDDDAKEFGVTTR